MKLKIFYYYKIFRLLAVHQLGLTTWIYTSNRFAQINVLIKQVCKIYVGGTILIYFEKYSLDGIWYMEVKN